jgi:hypothetical protein
LDRSVDIRSFYKTTVFAATGQAALAAAIQTAIMAE